MEEMVQVPRRLLEELATYLEGSLRPSVTVQDNGEWTQTMVGNLKDEIRAHKYRGAIATADAAAASPGLAVSIHQVVAASGIDKKQIAADLGAMSKAARRLFGRKVWPFRALDTSQGMTYLMQAEIAEWWNDASG